MNQWYRNEIIMKKILGLKNAGYTWMEIFNRIQSDENDFISAENLRKRFGENKYSIREIDLETSFYTWEEAYKNLCEYIGKKKKVKQHAKKQAKKRTKILCISDFHIPFHNEKLITSIVEEHKDADSVIIPGDFLDCYSVSRFSKKKNIPLKEELTQATAVLDFLANRFSKVTIIVGNHGDRVRKYFEQRIDPSLMFLVQYDVMELISHSYSNVHIVKDHYLFDNGRGEGEIEHFTVVGKDCVVGHFEKSSVIPIRAAQNSYNWIASWGKIFGIENVRLFLQGHTHRLSKYPIGDGTTTIGETGSLCQIQDYSIEASGKYTAHLNGYWVIYQDDGITDINNSNFILC